VTFRRSLASHPAAKPQRYVPEVTFRRSRATSDGEAATLRALSDFSP